MTNCPMSRLLVLCLDITKRRFTLWIINNVFMNNDTGMVVYLMFHINILSG